MSEYERQTQAEELTALYDQRISALTAERNLEQVKADVRGNMLRYISFVAGGDETADPQLSVDNLKHERDVAQRERIATSKLMLKRDGQIARAEEEIRTLMARVSELEAQITATATARPQSRTPAT